MNPTSTERAEWSRMARSAYSHGLNFYGHRYSAYAAKSGPITLGEYDGLMVNYRIWLVEGWDHFTQPTVEAR